MKRLVLVVTALVALALAGTATAGHVDLPAELERDALGLPADFQGAGGASDIHSDNMGLLANFDDGGTYREGTDLAFWGKTAVAGAYNTLRVLDVSDSTTVREVGQL